MKNMKITKQLTIVTLSLLLCGVLSACSGDKEEKEAGAVKQMTDKLGAEAAHQIQVPIERAKLVQGVQDGHTDKLNEAAE